MKVRYRPTVLVQLDNIFSYIGIHSRPSAQRVIARIKRSIDQLADFPYSGRPSEIADIRELPIVRYPYIAFYAVDEQAQERSPYFSRPGAPSRLTMRSSP